MGIINRGQGECITGLPTQLCNLPELTGVLGRLRSCARARAIIIFSRDQHSILCILLGLVCILLTYIDKTCKAYKCEVMYIRPG